MIIKECIAYWEYSKTRIDFIHYKENGRYHRSHQNSCSNLFEIIVALWKSTQSVTVTYQEEPCRLFCATVVGRRKILIVPKNFYSDLWIIWSKFYVKKCFLACLFRNKKILRQNIIWCHKSTMFHTFWI